GGVVPQPLDGEGLRVAIALDRTHLEVGAQQRTVLVLKYREDVSVDATADLVALGIDLDDLGHLDGPVALQCDGGGEGGDGLGGSRRKDEEQQDGESEKEPHEGEAHRVQAVPPPSPLRGRRCPKGG